MLFTRSQAQDPSAETEEGGGAEEGIKHIYYHIYISMLRIKRNLPLSLFCS